MIKETNALSEFIALYPQTDIQQLRTLVRNAQKELATGKPPKSSREIFKLLRDITAAESGHADDADQDDHESTAE
jgi:ribosome-associated protein